jgi:hypothetical protein
MIIVNFEGRLGNQMFQYAFALATAKRFKTTFNIHILHPNVYTFILEKYFDLPSYNFFWGRVLRSCFRKFGQPFFSTHEVSLMEMSRVEKLRNNIRFTRYFQSNLFFKDCVEVIKKEFTLAKKYVDEFNDIYKEVLEKNKIVVIHMRLTDYINNGWDLPISYYKSCLDRISNLEEYKVFVVSDDIDLAKKKIDYKGALHFQENSEIIDFQLLQHADIAIIPNSSFSWWAAYLNNKPNKVVLLQNIGWDLKRKKNSRWG